MKNDLIAKLRDSETGLEIIIVNLMRNEKIWESKLNEALFDIQTKNSEIEILTKINQDLKSDVDSLYMKLDKYELELQKKNELINTQKKNIKIIESDLKSKQEIIFESHQRNNSLSGEITTYRTPNNY